MTPTGVDPDGYWDGLPPPPGLLLEAREIGRWPAGQLLAAIDTDRHRHLLIAVPDQPRVSIARLRGMASDYRQLRAGGREGIWLDLHLLDDQGAPAFALLCSDVVAELSESTTPDPAAIAAVVRRWQRFWSSVPDGMSQESRLGLFGELWLLTQWLPDLTAAAVESWQGPLGGRHDFVNSDVSVEVKVSGVTTGPLVHRITNLAQLSDPEQGQLYLLSLRVASDAAGIHTLDALIDEVRGRAGSLNPGTADDIDERLKSYGWSPVHRGNYGDPLRVASEILYRIDDDFPRLTESSTAVPAGIVDVRYSLDMNVCSPWEVASGTEHHGLLDPLS